MKFDTSSKTRSRSIHLSIAKTAKHIVPIVSNGEPLGFLVSAELAKQKMLEQSNESSPELWITYDTIETKLELLVDELRETLKAITKQASKEGDNESADGFETLHLAIVRALPEVRSYIQRKGQARTTQCTKPTV